MNICKDKLLQIASENNFRVEFFSDSTCVNVVEASDRPSFMLGSCGFTLEQNIQSCGEFILQVVSDRAERAKHIVNYETGICSCGEDTFLCQECGEVFCSAYHHSWSCKMGNMCTKCFNENY